MKIRKKLRQLLVIFHLLSFKLKIWLLGFEYANVGLKNLNKESLILVLRKFRAKIGENCDIETGLVFHNCKDYSNLVIGSNCHIGKNCFFDLRDKVIIGNNVVISMQCTFITHIDMNKSPLRNVFPAKQAPILIEDNCYIGSGSQIIKGVTLGKNCFVTAKALVTKDVNSYTMVGGVPAKFIKTIK